MRSVHFAERFAAPDARAATSVPARLSPTAPACRKPFNWAPARLAWMISSGTRTLGMLRLLLLPA